MILLADATGCEGIPAIVLGEEVLPVELVDGNTLVLASPVETDHEAGEHVLGLVSPPPAPTEAPVETPAGFPVTGGRGDDVPVSHFWLYALAIMVFSLALVASRAALPRRLGE